MYSDDIWDEERWEAFLRENDRHMDRLMQDVYAFMRRRPPPGSDPEEARRWTDALRAFLIEKGWNDLGWLPPDAYLSDDWNEAVPPFQNSAGWGDDLAEDGDFRLLPVFQRAYALATRVLKWANEQPGRAKDSALVQYCSETMAVPTNIAKGHALGFDQEDLGGNIAYVKRALHAANAALDCLAEMKEAAYMDARVYASLYEETFEIRNGVALYILDLRERFRLGLD